MFLNSCKWRGEKKTFSNILDIFDILFHARSIELHSTYESFLEFLKILQNSRIVTKEKKNNSWKRILIHFLSNKFDRQAQTVTG